MVKASKNINAAYHVTVACGSALTSTASVKGLPSFTIWSLGFQVKRGALFAVRAIRPDDTTDSRSGTIFSEIAKIKIQLISSW